MFYKFPKSLNTDNKYKKLSNDAKLLYMYLLAKNDLSEKNAWQDDEGKIYIYCARKEMGGFLNASKSTTLRVFKQLTDAELVKKGKKNSNGSPKLYVKNLLSKNEVYLNEDTKEGDEISRLLLEQFIDS